jgi:thiol-disulfide isomerase/thioredoxin
MTLPQSPSSRSSAREFTIIVICALGLSVAFVFWLKTSPGFGRFGGLEVGESAPPIRADEWVGGAAPPPEDPEGEVRVLVAWATWCGPCAREAPHLVEVYQAFAERGVQFIGLTSAPVRERGKIIDWLEARGITWPNGFGPQATETLIAFDAQVIPLVWVIGRDGTILWNHSRQGEESLEDALERALQQPPKSPRGAAPPAESETGEADGDTP